MKSLGKMFAGTASLKIISTILVALSGIFFARLLGPDGYGRYAYILSIVTLLTVPVIAGVPNLLVKEVANYQLKNNYGLLAGLISWTRSYILKISILMMILVFLSNTFGFVSHEISSTLYIGSILILLRGMLVQHGAILNGYRKPLHAQLPTQLMPPIFVIILTIIALLIFDLDLDVYTLVTINVIGSVFALFLSKLFLFDDNPKEINDVRKEYNRTAWKNSLIPFALITILISFNTDLATFFVGWLSEPQYVAYFKVAMQATMLISIGLSSVNTVIMPNIARYFTSGDLRKTQELLSKSVKTSFIFSLPLIIILITFGDYLIIFLFGSEYVMSYKSLIILCFGQLFNVLMGSVGAVLYMTNNEKKAIPILFLALLINILLLVFLIPIYKDIGAAIATSISMVVWNLLMSSKVKELTGLKTWLRF